MRAVVPVEMPGQAVVQAETPAVVQVEVVLWGEGGGKI